MCAIGRTLMARPRLLMLDEPALGPAPLLVAPIFETVKRIDPDRVTVLLVSGHLVRDGDAQNLLGDERLKRAFLGLRPCSGGRRLLVAPRRGLLLLIPVAEPIPETETSQPPPAPAISPPAGTPDAPRTVSDRLAAWVQHPSLPHMQTIVGLLAGILSIGGFAYSYFWATTPVVPTRGEVIAAAVDARTEKTIPDATLEVFTLKDALVTTLTPDASGRARHSIKEGSYRLRVSHPRFNPEARTIFVIAGNTADIRVRLSPRPSASVSGSPAAGSPATGASGGGASPTKEIGKAVDEGVNAVKKIFR